MNQKNENIKKTILRTTLDIYDYGNGSLKKDSSEQDKLKKESCKQDQSGKYNLIKPTSEK